jgi:hypothetical protein
LRKKTRAGFCAYSSTLIAKANEPGIPLVVMPTRLP